MIERFGSEKGERLRIEALAPKSAGGRAVRLRAVRGRRVDEHPKQGPCWTTRRSTGMVPRSSFRSTMWVERMRMMVVKVGEPTARKRFEEIFKRLGLANMARERQKGTDIR